MTEEAFLRSVIPTVTLAGHGLHKIVISQLLDELLAGIMAALVAVDNRFMQDNTGKSMTKDYNSLDWNFSQ